MQIVQHNVFRCAAVLKPLYHMLLRVASADPYRRGAIQRPLHKARLAKARRAIEIHARVLLNRCRQLSQRLLRKSHLTVHRFLLNIVNKPSSLSSPVTTFILLRGENPVNAARIATAMNTKKKSSCVHRNMRIAVDNLGNYDTGDNAL